MSKDLIDRLIDATSPMSLFEAAAEAAIEPYREMLPPTLELNEIFTSTTVESVAAALPLVRSIVEVQAEELGEHLEEIVAFYESPAGKRWMASLDNIEDPLHDLAMSLTAGLADRLEEKIALYHARKRNQS